MVDLVPPKNVRPRPATAEQWGQKEVRPTLRKLYLEENKLLKVVMAEMIKLLGFHATYVKPLPPMLSVDGLDC